MHTDECMLCETASNTVTQKSSCLTAEPGNFPGNKCSGAEIIQNPLILASTTGLPVREVQLNNPQCLTPCANRGQWSYKGESRL